MRNIETYMLHGICLRLVRAIPVGQGSALVLARWIADQPDVFGIGPNVRPAGRHQPGVNPQDWRALGDCLAAHANSATEPFDQQLDRLQTITSHLGLGFEEEAILRFLALQQRAGPVSEFGVMLQGEIGLSAEAVITWCCNLDEMAVWTALAPQGRLVALGLVQTDGTLAVMRDDPYTLSGLLLALLHPPNNRPRLGIE